MIRSLAQWLVSRPRKRPPTTITAHATAGGSASGAISTLRLRGLSYHYLIEKNGNVIKCCPAGRVAFHAGVSTGPEGKGVNEYSIGISFVNLNDGKDKLTDAQLNTFASLCGELCAAYPSLRWLTAHYSVSWGRKTDPKLFDLQGMAVHVGLTAWKQPAAMWRTF